MGHFENDSLSDLKYRLSNFENEQKEIDKLVIELPKKIEVLTEKYRKVDIKLMNAKGWLEEAVDDLERATERKERLPSIIEELKEEIRRR